MRLTTAVLLAMRTVTVVLLLGWHAVAGGVGGLVHLCAKRAEVRLRCCCPAQAKAAGAQHVKVPAQPAEGPSVKAVCCQTTQVPPLQMAARADSTLAAYAAAPALPAPAWLTPPLPGVASLHTLAALEPYRGQGPPLFLRVRSLLL